MAQDPEHAASDPNPHRRLRRLLIIAGGLSLLLLLCLVAAMLPHLLHPVPIPPAVKRIQDQRESHTAETTAKKTSRTSNALQTSSHEPVIPEDPSQPTDIITKRSAFNAEYAELISDMDSFDQQKRTMSFPDSLNQLDSFHRRLLDICGRFAREWKKSGGDYLEPSYRAVVKQWASLQKRIDDAQLENYIRHEKWKIAALLRQQMNWEEGVYYWRRQGGLESIWRIGAGGLERQLREKRMFSILWRFLPYPDPDTGSIR